MKNSKGNGLITVIIVIIIILIITAIGLFIYKYVVLDNQQVNTNSEEINNNLETTQTPNLQNNTEVIKPIIDPNEDLNNNNEQQLISKSYYYNQLNSYGKTIYDKLKQNKDKFITGNYVFDFENQFNVLLHEANGEEELGQAFQSAWNALSYDEVDLFYVDISKMTLITQSRGIGGINTYNVSIGPGENTNYLKEEFQTQEQIQEAQAYIKNITDQIMQQTTQDSDVEKARKVQNWLISTIDYENSNDAKNKHDIYGALHDRKAVCEGYARSFKYIMEKIGVPCILVSGNGTNSEGKTESHAWNYIQIDYKWYAIDVTWNDPVIIGTGTLTDEIKYKYFLNGSEEFFKNHKEDGLISENSMKFTFPTLSTTNYQWR
ncbi:MAG: transglutaminase domain-containing protein [Clostridia bacterium]